jgi:hypothetical protein
MFFSLFNKVRPVNATIKRMAALAVIVVVLAWFSPGCNPLRRIDMKNRSGQDVEIRWKLKDLDSIYKSDFFISNSDNLTFQLKPEKPYNEVKMSFGVGLWKPEDLAAVTDRLESLRIRSSSGTLELKTSEEIYQFLSHRRKGIGKRKILILIRD